MKKQTRRGSIVRPNEASIELSVNEKNQIDIYLRCIGSGSPTFNTTVHSDDEMYLYSLDCGSEKIDALCQYFGSGIEMMSTVRQILNWGFGEISNVASFMDFACGYGRFTRFLVEEMAPEKIVVSDIYAEAIEFQIKTFGVRGVHSCKSPENYENPDTFDCIFVASLFSHLPQKLFLDWLMKLQTLLTPRGLLIFSVHGFSLKPEEVQSDNEGFAYVPKSESRSLENEIYGTTYVADAFVEKAIKSVFGESCSMHRISKGLCGFQDLYIVSKDPARKTSPLKVSSAPVGHLDRCEYLDDGEVHFSGWAFDTNDNPASISIQIYKNKEIVQSCRPFRQRLDVARHFADERVLFSGWSCAINSKTLKPDDILTVKIMNENQQSRILKLGTLAPMLMNTSETIRECKEVHQQTTYFEDAEPYMAAQWEEIIWPVIKNFDFDRVLELAPGYGRNTEFLIREALAREIYLVDVNQHCIDACKRRFTNEKRCRLFYFVNDGKSLGQVPDNSISSIYSWDSMVHFDKFVMELYIKEFARVLEPGGKGFVHHSNYGHISQSGDWQSHPHNRSNMTDELFAEHTKYYGLKMVSQKILDWEIEGLDCISVFEKS